MGFAADPDLDPSASVVDKPNHLDTEAVTLDLMRRYCAKLPGATRDIKWGADEVYSVGGRMFAVFGIDGKKATTASFKCEPDRFLELTDQPGIVPAPYLARAHWVQVQETKALTAGQARDLLARSHALVFAKLTRKQQAAVGGMSPPDHKL